MPDIARFTGGPLDGKILGLAIWPPPSFFPAVTVRAMCLASRVEPELGIAYRCESFSNLTDEQAAHPNLARGAQYIAEPDDGSWLDLPKAAS